MNIHDAKAILLEKLTEVKTEPGTDAHRILSQFIRWVEGL